MDDVIHYSRWVDLHYSPDDGGWYAHDYQTDQTTAGLYKTADELRAALDAGTAKWEA